MKGVAFLLLGAVILAQGFKPQLTLSGRVCHCNPNEAVAICSQHDSDGELVVHEHCNQFYKCFDGKAIPFFCPSNLLYNPLAEKCDWPFNVDCGSRPIVEENDLECSQETNDDSDEGISSESGSGNDNDGNCNCNPEEAPGICATEGSDGVLVAHVNCNQFYKCDHGVPVVLSCNENLLYNPQTEQCDWPEKVECGDRPIVEIDNENGEGGSSGGNGDNENENEDGGNGDNGSTGTCNCNPGEAPGICAAEGSDNILVAHENCNQFFKCANGVPVVFSCSGGLLYNPHTERCDWPEKVECGDRPIVEIDNGNGEGGSSGGNGDNENENEDSGNGDNGSTGTCNCNPGEAPGICAAEGSDNVLVAHENCNQFFKCANGSPVTITCPAGLVYNPYIECCDWPENVDCGDKPIVEIEGGNNGNGDSGNGDSDNDNAGSGDNENGDSGSGNGSGDNTCNCNPVEAPGICALDGSDGSLIAHENCNQFYKCNNGSPVTMTCPTGLVYNPYIECCDWPHNVECGDKPIIEGGESEDSDNGAGNESGEADSGNGESGNGNEDGGNGDNGSTGTCNCNPGEAPGICAAEGSDNVLIAHENCNQFFKCANGVPVVFSCSGGLLYNPHTERCDWPEKVECGDRPIVEIDNGNGEGGSSGGNGDNENENEDSGNGDNGSTGTCNCNPGEAPGICAAEGSDNVLVAHENCNQFFKCANGSPVTITCPAGLVYNPYIECCDWPENVDCGDKPTVEIEGGNNGNGDSGNGDSDNDNAGSGDNENGDSGSGNGSGDNTCNCNPVEAPGICALDGSDGSLIAHENCNQFYKCNNGSPVTMTCPTGLVYNPYIECCDWPHNVECGDKPIVEGGESEDSDNGTGNESGEAGSGNGESGNGNEDGGNGDNSSTGTCNCNPGEAPGICAAEGSDNVLIAHENCNQFFKCANGVPVVFSCSGGLLYNPHTERCDWPEKVECGDRPIVEIDGGSNGNSGNGDSDNEIGNGGEDIDNGGNGGTCNCNPEEAPAICITGNSEGVFIAHEECNKFYKCSFGSPVAVKCPGILFYNPVLEVCDWPQNVECGDRVILENEEQDNDSGDNNDNGGDGSDSSSSGPFTDPSEAPAICETAGYNGVLVAHEDCDKFYVCSGGSPVALQCPSNLLYNPSIELCDWPSNVDCDNRTVPEVEVEDGGPCLCNSKEAPGICAGSDSTGKMIAHENCNQFYVCFNGKPIARSCPASLFYEPHTKACNWPAAVNCDGRDVTEHLSLNKHMQARRGIF